jgi:glycosyltransferase involved in cell wall biosynthesis
MARLIGALANRLLVHHPQSVRPVNDLYGARAKIRIVPHPDYGKAGVPGDREQVRMKWGLESQFLWALIFGGVRRYKRIDLAIKAAAALQARGIRLVIAGQCPDALYRAELESAAAGRVAFILRELSDSELDELILASDVVLLPHAESLTSGAIHRAVSFSRPVVCSSAVAFDEFIRLGLAIKADMTRVDALADAVLQAAQSPPTPAAVEAFRAERRPNEVGKILADVYAEVRLRH